VGLFTITDIQHGCHPVILLSIWHGFQVLLELHAKQVVTRPDSQQQRRVAAQPRDDGKASTKNTGMVYGLCQLQDTWADWADMGLCKT